MKRLVVLLFTVSFLLCFLPSGAYSLDVYGIEVANTMSFEGTYIAGEAQVKNPGFEQGKAGWFMAQTSGTNCAFSIDSDAYEGSLAAKLDVTNDGYCMLGNSTSILILRTGTYTLNVYAKVSGDVNHLTIAVWKAFVGDTSPDIPVDSIKPNVFSGDYELHQLTLDLIEGEFIRIELGINNNASGPSYALFDKVELVNPSGPYTWEKEVVSIDATTFSPTTTHVIEYTMEGSSAGKDWFETTFIEITTPSESRLWGEEDIYGDFYRYSSSLVTAWYPMQVNDHKDSLATIVIEGFTFNASLTADVLTVESVDLGFDTFDAYKLRYVTRIWGYGLDMRMTFYYWWVPYLGFVKYQDQGVSEVLTDFAIGGGTITQDTDTDNDGLQDYEELIKYNTDRLDSDSDDDGLSDFDEVNTHGSDPNDDDTDDDGLTDGDEVNTHGTDPTLEDTDNDGLNDGDEVNTYLTLPNEPDTDGDELSDGDEIAIGTNPNIPDTDEDGMPDGWEVTYGLEPLINDADGDLDDDGMNNLEEYQKGRHPNNAEPNTPELFSPPDGEQNVSLTPELETGDFSDNDEDDHALTHWQISTAPFPVDSEPEPEDLVVDLTSDTQLTLLEVPPLILNANNTEYFWRARFNDSDNATSEWAAFFSFTTLDASPEDNDPADGIPDGQEADCLAIFDPDAVPQDTACFNSVVGNAQIGMQGSNNVASIEACGSVDPVTIPEGLQGVELAIGLISFKATCNQAGDIIEIIYYSSEPIPAGAKWYKYDPINGWQDYSAHIVSISPDRKTITVEYQDGGFGDLDGVANGVIIDPSGPGVAAAGGGGGGGGCLISTAAYGFRMPKESLALVLFLGLLMIGFSAFRKKFMK